MSDLTVGDRAPDFALLGTAGPVHLVDLLARGPVVISFHQEDGTPACRQQLAAFRDDAELLAEAGATLIAISTDPLASHATFAADLGCGFPLLTDEGGAIARLYGVYDPEARRARRAVFVVGADGVIALALPWYNAANVAQYEQVFRALGLGG